MNTLNALKWRYAVKSFAPNKKLSKEQLEGIQEALLLTASSMGMQLMEFVIIENQTVKEQLKPFSYHQPQITDCSHLIVLCRKARTKQKHIDEVVQRVSEVRNIPSETLTGYASMMQTSLHLNTSSQIAWMENQVYIALGNLLTYCALEGIDTCPIEGFEKNRYNEILELPEQGLHSVVVCAIGFRSSEDKYAHLKKVRKTKEQLFKLI